MGEYDDLENDGFGGTSFSGKYGKTLRKGRRVARCQGKLKTGEPCGVRSTRMTWIEHIPYCAQHAPKPETL